MVNKLEKKVVIRFNLELLTGMRIGGSDPGIAIGAIDSPVIRDPITGTPFIPGSSLKGKLRSSLEKVLGEYANNGRQGNDPTTVTGKLFGIAADQRATELTSTRLIVRDAFLTKESEEVLKSDSVTKFLDAPFTEVKTEIGVDRLSGGPQRGNLRQVERVPRGAVFACEAVLSIWEDDDERELTQALANSLLLLETEYIGGSGTRGYGQVKVIPTSASVLSFNTSGKAETKQLHSWEGTVPFISLLHEPPKELGTGE